MFNLKIFTLLLITLFYVSAPFKVHAAENSVVSENIIHLQDDGKSYLLHRTMRTDSPGYTFHVDKEHQLDNFYYISPNDYEWDEKSSETTNIIKFPQGNFVVMYAGEFKNNLSIDENGIYHFKSWDGETRDDGLFGYWNSPGDYSNFVYVWVIPKHFEIVSYKSNRDGKWVTRNNSITFFATETNNLTFEISYRLLDSDIDGVSDNKDYCPETIANTAVNEYGCDADSDHDKVADNLDQCPDTAAGLVVDAIGCELDTDKDGVVDSLDPCPTTAAGLIVDASGCELDTDKDGIVDSLDQCPTTAADLIVDANGCELDTDKDGIVNSLDQCPTTAAGLVVDASGCELDLDKDGVINEKDLCPDTAVNVDVDETGCVVAAPINLKGVNFKTASAQLLSESRLILDNVADILAVHTKLIIEIGGHTDSSGAADINMALSQRRAEAVRDYLLVKGISAQTLSAKGYGETLPLSDNVTAQGRKINRRVELKRLN